MMVLLIVGNGILIAHVNTQDLFFSEYVEGSSNNKALEIYNGTGYTLNLSNYTIKLGSNGGVWSTTNILTLTGTLASGDVFVVANPNASSAILGVSDVTSTVTYFNGDDCVGLFYFDTLIDVIGLYLNDPGIAWNVAGVTEATLNHTLVRKSIVGAGNTDWNSSAGTDAVNSEWQVLANDDISNLGVHNCSYGMYSPPYIQNFDQVTAPNLPYDWSMLKISASSSAFIGTYSSSGYAYNQPNCVRLHNGFDTNANLFLIAPPIQPDFSITTIQVNFWASSSGAGFPLIVGVMSDIFSHNSFTQVLSIPLTTTLTEYSVSFSSYSGTGIYIAFKHGLGGINRSIYVDNVTLDQVDQIDLACTELAGYETPSVGFPSPYSATIFNNSTTTQSNYLVKLFDIDNNILAEANGSPVEPNTSLSILIWWTPTYEGPVSISAKVFIIGDINPSNDQSPALPVVVMPALIRVTGNLQRFIVEQGELSESQSYMLSCAGMTQNLTIAAPAGFEVSTDNVSFNRSLSLPPNFEGWIFVRLNAITIASYDGSIMHSTVGAPDVALPISGIVCEVTPLSLLLIDNFYYDLNVKLSNTRWIEHSGTGINDLTVSAGSLDIAGYPASLGNSVQFANTGQDVHRVFEPQNSGAVYASALVNVTTAKVAGDYILHFSTNPINTSNYVCRVFIQKHATLDTYRFGLAHLYYAADAVWTDYLYSPGTTYLLVMKYEFVPGGVTNDLVHLFVNPDISGTEPMYTLTATDAIPLEPANIGSIALRQGADSKGPVATLDGIRVANSWANLWNTDTTVQIIVTGGLTAFSAYLGAPSVSQSYHLDATGLIDNIEVNAPLGFEISTNNADWQTNLSLSPSFNGIVWVRFNPSYSGSYTGSITHTSTGANQISIPVSGTGLATIGVINLSTTFVTITTPSGTPSTAQQIGVYGTTLINNIIAQVMAPFQIKKTTDSTWGSSVELPPGFNGNLDVRLVPTADGLFTGSIFFSSLGASDKYVSLHALVGVGVNTIAELRALTADNETCYTLLGEAVVTFKQAFRNQKFIQDNTAAILIDDINGVISSDYQIGSGITGITGTLYSYFGMLEFIPVSNPGTPTTGYTIVPQQVRLSDLAADFESYEAELVKITGVTFDSADGSMTFSPNTAYSMNTGTMSFFTNFSNVNYISTVIPTGTLDIIVLPFSKSTGNYFAARSLADFTDYSPQLQVPQVIISFVNNSIRLDWDPIEGAASYRIEISDNPFGSWLPLSSTTHVYFWDASLQRRFYRVIAEL